MGFITRTYHSWVGIFQWLESFSLFQMDPIQDSHRQEKEILSMEVGPYNSQTHFPFLGSWYLYTHLNFEILFTHNFLVKTPNLFWLVTSTRIYPFKCSFRVFSYFVLRVKARIEFPRYFFPIIFYNPWNFMDESSWRAVKHLIIPKLNYKVCFARAVDVTESKRRLIN